jgi:hypothetical protein
MWTEPDGSGKLAIRLWDAYGDPVAAHAAADWTVSGGGTIDSTGLFRSSGETGDFDVRVRLKGDTAVSATGIITVSGASVLPFVRRINFQPDTVPWREGWQGDNGANYSQARGFGWLGAYITGTFNNRNGETFLLKSFIQANGVWHCDAPDGDYVIKTAMGDNAWGSQQACHVTFGQDTLCYKPAGTLNTLRTDTVTVSGGKGIDLNVSGALCYLVIISKNGVDMELVADDKIQPLTRETSCHAAMETLFFVNPNPFNPSTNIIARIFNDSRLTLYGINGKILNRWALKTGLHRISWQARRLPAGCYFLVLKIGNGRQLTRKVMLLK